MNMYFGGRKTGEAGKVITLPGLHADYMEPERMIQIALYLLDIESNRIPSTLRQKAEEWISDTTITIRLGNEINSLEVNEIKDFHTKNGAKMWVQRRLYHYVLETATGQEKFHSAVKCAKKLREYS